MRKILDLRRCSPFDPAVQAFIQELDRLHVALYPAESNHLDSLETLSQPNCTLLGAFRDEKLVGIGAAKVLEGYGELKRFFVPKEHRGEGIAECLISALELELTKKEIRRACLETGVEQIPAIRFYERMGYRRRAPFGDYKEDPLSLFMERDLSRISIQAHSGPIHLVAFSSELREPSPRYAELAREMAALVQKQRGYLGMSSVRGKGGKGFTVSYWSDLEAIAEWGREPRHQVAQELGRVEFYRSFRTTVARAEW